MKKAIQNYLAKLHDNKKDKGFSLVELIIVIAIMAILVGVVASQVLPYIEKSRKSKDQEALSNVSTEMITAISDALADGSQTEASFKVTVTSSGATGNSGGGFGELVMKKYGSSKNVSSDDGIVAVAAAEGEEGSSTGTGFTVDSNANTALKKVAEGLKSKASNGTFVVEYTYTPGSGAASTREIRVYGGDGSDSAVEVKGSLQ